MSGKVIKFRASASHQHEISEADDPALLAIRVGVSTSCIYAIRSGKTKWPRKETLFSICRVLGWVITMRRA